MEASKVENSDESEDDESEDEERTTMKTMEDASSQVGKKDAHDEKDDAKGVEAPNNKRERTGDSDKAPPSKVRKEQKVGNKGRVSVTRMRGSRIVQRKEKRPKRAALCLPAGLAARLPA